MESWLVLGHVKRFQCELHHFAKWDRGEVPIGRQGRSVGHVGQDSYPGSTICSGTPTVTRDQDDRVDIENLPHPHTHADAADRDAADTEV